MKLLAKVLVLMSLGLSAQAAESKVAFVDMQKAIQSTKAGKKAKESLDTEYQKRKKDLDKKKADIEKMGQDLEKKKAVLSEEVLGRKQMELQEEMMKFQKVVAENQLEIQKREKELVEPILEKLRSAIEKVAKEQKISMVFEKGPQNILYADKDSDITDAVIAAFEK